MRYQLLGRSGLRVSELCLGTMTFGEDWGWGSSLESSRAIYDAFREAGGNFIDTANIYTEGSSEKYLGEFLQGHRDQLVLATKYTNANAGKDPNAGGNHRKNMMQACEASLRRMRTDYIDLYWLHIWDQITPADEVMRGFDDLVRQGKILHAGISDAPAWWIARANTIAEFRGQTPFIGLQIEYSLIERTVERELIPMAKAMGLGVTAWSPLTGGILSGKYARGQGSGGRYGGNERNEFKPAGERVEKIVGALLQVSQKINRSPAQIALAWLRHRDMPVIPIIGARKLDQFRDNLECLNIRLSDEQLATLDEASSLPLGFPHEFFKKDRVRTIVYGGLRDQIDA